MIKIIKQYSPLWGEALVYYLNNKVHREDGPAIERKNGRKAWYYHGKYIKCSSQKEFEKLIKLQAFW